MLTLTLLILLTIIGGICAIHMHKVLNLKFLLEHRDSFDYFYPIIDTVIFICCGPVGWYFAIMYIMAYSFFKFNTLMEKKQRVTYKEI